MVQCVDIEMRKPQVRDEHFRRWALDTIRLWQKECKEVTGEQLIADIDT